MEVLTRVDAGRIGRLVAADEFFWLDLEDPSASDLDHVGRALPLHPLALEDTRESRRRTARRSCSRSTCTSPAAGC